MFCPNCGAGIDDRAKFCNHCGAPIQPMQNMAGGGSVSPKKKSPVPFIIIGAAVLVVIIGIVVVSAVIREKRMADSYYDFYTKDEFNQMIQEEYGNEENNRTKGIGEKTVEDVINSYYGDGNEDDEELQEKLKNSSSPWFKDPGDDTN